MSIIDDLMAMDMGDFKKNEGDLTLKLARNGKKVTFHCVELDPEDATRLSEESLNLTTNGDITISTFNTKIKTILLGCPNVFSNQTLQSKYSCATSMDLIKRILTNEEITKLADFITGLASCEVVAKEDEIKN